MLIWIGICLVVIVLCVLEFVYLWSENDAIDAIAIILICAAVSVLISALAIGLENRKETIEYLVTDRTPVICEQTCTYDEAVRIVENHDINEWIEHAKLQRKVNGIFSLYPASVMDLEPID